MRILGLDEAGRGCVLGPLVVGAFLFEGEDQLVLKKAGAADSKALSPKKREEVLERLEKLGTAKTIAIAALEIEEGNLNTLEINAFIELARHFKPEQAFLDAPVHPRGIPKLKNQLIKATGVQDWVVEPKADASWPVVGAASIFAKVTRDRSLSAIVCSSGELGSGYPSDPVTRSLLKGFLARGEPLPDWVRSRWGTLEVLKDELRQSRLF
jgi:ribonuclease HII